ncbi:MAG: AsnC family protein [Acidobacteria bacterium]|nr:AsnC family protein [Acidobacteriota bacterium]
MEATYTIKAREREETAEDTNTRTREKGAAFSIPAKAPAEVLACKGRPPVGPLEVPAEVWAWKLAEARERAARADDLDRLILEARDARLTCGEIGDLVGLDASTVARRLRKIGKATGKSVS